MFILASIFKKLIFVFIFEVYVRAPSSLRSPILRSLKSLDVNLPASPFPPTHLVLRSFEVRGLGFGRLKETNAWRTLAPGGSRCCILRDLGGRNGIR